MKINESKGKSLGRDFLLNGIVSPTRILFLLQNPTNFGIEMTDFQPPQLLWKRPDDVPFPHVWLRYETKVVNGKSYRVRIQEIEENRFEETLDFMDKYYNDAEPSCK